MTVLLRGSVEDGAVTHEQFGQRRFTVTAPAAACLIAVQAGNMVTSMLPRGIPSVDSGMHKNQLTDGLKKHGATDGIFYQGNGKNTSQNRIPCSPLADTLAVTGLVWGALTIHTCSLYLKLHHR